MSIIINKAQSYNAYKIIGLEVYYEVSIIINKAQSYNAQAAEPEGRGAARVLESKRTR